MDTTGWVHNPLSHNGNSGSNSILYIKKTQTTVFYQEIIVFIQGTHIAKIIQTFMLTVLIQ